MQRNVISIRQLGLDVCWTLIQQALGMPDVKMNSDYMTDKVALLLFARPSLPERLCCTAAVRQMGGTTIYAGDNHASEWQDKNSPIQTHLLPIFGYYLDCMYIYGIPANAENVAAADLRFPVINAGGIGMHPSHAMADVACMLKIFKQLDGVRAGWIGSDNGTLYSLIELMGRFKFSLKISMPPEIDNTRLQERAKAVKADVEFVDSPKKAARDANFIYAGRRESRAEDNSPWQISQEIMKLAEKDAKLLLSASPIRAVHIDPEILNSRSSLLTAQAEYRLAVHKRILHWVFSAK